MEQIFDVAKKVASADDPELHGWFNGEFFDGLCIVLRWLPHRHSTPRCDKVKAASKTLLRFAVGMYVVFLVILSCIWFASLVVFGILFTLAPIYPLEFVYTGLRFKHVLSILAFLVPQCIVAFLRYYGWQQQDEVFLAALCQDDIAATHEGKARLHRMAGHLKELPVESVWSWLKGYVCKGCRNAGLGLALYVLSYLPYVGPAAIPAGLFFKKRQQIGLFPTISLAIISFLPETAVLPSGRLLATGLSQMVFGVRATWNELLFSITGRRDTRHLRRALARKPHARIMGFATAACAILSIPMVGSLFWFDIVSLTGRFFADVVLEGDEDAFDLEPAVERLRQQQERVKAEEEDRARMRRAREQASHKR
eukprot:TRINITY_DN103157_c0_g1_i1.p1 TRINITY_DN103157_c0_g1~~TRINITY_DN103157_c0_g1_i1.p1  ORF type:complete len:367 (+),score=37.83 TRINITY_DN103157_c0_g1_i1:83-1183(+)